MPRRKRAGAPDGPAGTLGYEIALDDLRAIRLELHLMQGGMLARIRAIVDKHLGPEERPPRGPCPG